MSVEIRALLAATACICFTQFGKKKNITKYFGTAGQAGKQHFFISVLWEDLAEQETHSKDQLADLGNQVAFAAFTYFVPSYLETNSAPGVLYFTACQESGLQFVNDQGNILLKIKTTNKTTLN